MEKKTISVKINNDTYMLQTEADEQDVLEVAALVDKKLKALAENKHILDKDKAAIWTALDIAGDYVELKKRYERLLAAATER